MSFFSYEQPQDLAFVFCQLHALPVVRYDVVADVELHVLMREQIGLSGKIVCAPQDGLDLSDQHLAVEWLGDKIVRAPGDGHDDVHVVVGA